MDIEPIQTQSNLSKTCASNCNKHQTISLAPQQKIEQTALSNAQCMRVLEGAVLIYTMAMKTQRYVLDFLFAGDALVPAIFPAALRISVRAVTPTTIYASHHYDSNSQFSSESTNVEVIQVAQSIMQRMMISHLATEDRVASAFISLALRCSEIRNNVAMLPMPMSRDDLADYIAVNPDTLSRITCKFEEQKLIERVNRHKIILLDVERLAKMSTLAPHFIKSNGAIL